MPLPLGFVPPCLPAKAPSPPAGDVWLHEIKHDGFRVIARKDGPRVKLYSRPGNDLTRRFPLIVEALARLRASSCIIDGEAVACGDDGISSFNLLRHRWRHDAVFLYAFDLIELTGDDRRRDPLEQRKLDLSRLLAKAGPGLRLNEWIDGGEHDGMTIFFHACKLGRAMCNRHGEGPEPQLRWSYPRQRRRMAPVDQQEDAETDDQETGADLDLLLPFNDGDQQRKRKYHYQHRQQMTEC